MSHILHTETILYIANQQKSADFYSKLLCQKPVLNVPGMTAFKLTENSKLGLMPNESIAKIITPEMPHPTKGKGIPRCELYLYVNNINFQFENAVKAGAKLISPIEDRSWGDKVCYFADPDGHIIAFAEKLNNH